MRTKRKFLISFMLLLGVFINISSNNNADNIHPTKEVISIFEDELIGGKH